MYRLSRSLLWRTGWKKNNARNKGKVIRIRPRNSWISKLEASAGIRNCALLKLPELRSPAETYNWRALSVSSCASCAPFRSASEVAYKRSAVRPLTSLPLSYRYETFGPSRWYLVSAKSRILRCYWKPWGSFVRLGRSLLAPRGALL